MSSAHVVKQVWHVNVLPSSISNVGQIQVALPAGVLGLFTIKNLGPDTVQVTNNIDRPLAAGATFPEIAASAIGLQVTQPGDRAFCVVEATLVGP